MFLSAEQLLRLRGRLRGVEDGIGSWYAHITGPRADASTGLLHSVATDLSADMSHAAGSERWRRKHTAREQGDIEISRAERDVESGLDMELPFLRSMFGNLNFSLFLSLLSCEIFDRSDICGIFYAKSALNGY